MVTIRGFEKRDAGRLVELLNCEEVSRWTGNIPFPYTLKDAQDWLSGAVGQSDRRPYAVEYEGKLVACVSYWSTSETEYEVGYWVGKEYWNKNIASNALSLFLDHDVFPRCSKVVAKVIVGNIGSERVLLKNGFIFVGDCKLKKNGKVIDGKVFEKEFAI